MRCRDLEAQILALKSVHKNEMDAASLSWKEISKVKSQLELSNRREEVLKTKNVELVSNDMAKAHRINWTFCAMFLRTCA